METIQYTIRGISKHVDGLIRQHAKEHGKSLNQEILDILQRSSGVDTGARFHDLDELAGSWIEDEQFDRVMEDFSEIDEGLWQ